MVAARQYGSHGALVGTGGSNLAFFLVTRAGGFLSRQTSFTYVPATRVSVRLELYQVVPSRSPSAVRAVYVHAGLYVLHTAKTACTLIADESSGEVLASAALPDATPSSVWRHMTATTTPSPNSTSGFSNSAEPTWTMLAVLDGPVTAAHLSASAGEVCVLYQQRQQTKTVVRQVTVGRRPIKVAFPEFRGPLGRWQEHQLTLDMVEPGALVCRADHDRVPLRVWPGV